MTKARGLADLGNAYSDGALSNRNMLINSDMRVAQRGTSLSAPQGYTLDRWKSIRFGIGEYTVSQQAITDLTGFSKCARVQRNSGTTSTNEAAFNQPVEQLNSARAAGQTVTLSFWLRVGANYSGTAGSLKSGIAYTTSATDVGMNYDNFTAGGTSSLVSRTGTTSWVYHTQSFAIPSTAKQVGVAFTTTAWSGTAGAADYYEITGIQLEAGDTATPFEHRSYAAEYQSCARYYWSGDATDGITGCNLMTNSNTTYISASCVFPVAMRADPTVLAHPTGTTINGLAQGPGTTVDFNSTTFSFSLPNTSTVGMSRARFSSLSATPVANTVYAARFIPLAFDAEL